MLAACTGLWLIYCLILGGRHEAEIRHCTDNQGNVVHAPKMVGAHTGSTSDIHATDGDGDHDLCAIAMALHQAGATPAGPTVATCGIGATCAELRASSEVSPERGIYRWAPKTSPPACG